MRRLVGFVGLVAALVLSTTGLASAAGTQWNIARVGAPASAKGTIIAVVDTGVDGGHPALGGRVLPQWDCTGSGGNCVQKNSGDPNSHGTHVAGIAAGAVLACGNTGPSAIGVAPDAKILPIRVLGADGSGSTTGVANGIDKAVALGADVINLSLGGDLQGLQGPSGVLVDAINRAWKAGSVPVVAAGNGALFGLSFGSGYRDLDGLVVTATDNQNRAPGYADGVGGAKWGIAAPGGSGSTFESSILSTLPNGGCGTKNGTSMATPHVAGAAAALRSKGLNPGQIVDRLLATATDLGTRGTDSTYGAGLLNLAAATQGLGGAQPPPAPAPAPAAASPTPAPTSGATAPVPSTTAGPAAAPGGPTPAGAPTDAAADAGSGTTSTAPSTTSSDDVTLDESEGAEGGSRVPVVGPGAAETASGDLEVAIEGGARSIPAPLAASAGLACAVLWFVLGKNAARLRA